MITPIQLWIVKKHEEKTWNDSSRISLHCVDFSKTLLFIQSSRPHIMAFECNIDARGKAARLRMGMLGVAGGIFLGFSTLAGILPSTIGYLMAAGAIGGGAFAMWEARMGWCVVRAMGFKTRL
jgi:hypothetical protein